MDPVRFIVVYVLNGIISALLTFVVYKILKRNLKNRFNQMFSMAYISLLASIILNCIYALIEDLDLVVLVNILGDFTDFFIFLATGFILLSLLIILNPEKMLEKNNEFVFIICYGALAAIMFYIPDTGITISADGVQSSPKMDLPLFIFNLIFYSAAFIITIIVSIKILSKIVNIKVKRKFMIFIIGILLLYYFPFGMAFANFLDTPDIREIHMILSILVVPGAYLIFYGIGTELHDNE